MIAWSAQISDQQTETTVSATNHFPPLTLLGDLAWDAPESAQPSIVCRKGVVSSKEQLMQLVFCSAVLKECLRLHPPGPAFLTHCGVRRPSHTKC